jgi:hypothetical protein
MASEIWSLAMLSASAKSAIVRATFFSFLCCRPSFPALQVARIQDLGYNADERIELWRAIGSQVFDAAGFIETFQFPCGAFHLRPWSTGCLVA